MKRLIDLVRGWPGKPSHPPLTDASIGAYTAGVLMLVAGALGLEERQMAHGALVATLHLLTMVAATLVFAGAWLAQRPGYLDGRIETLGLWLGVGAELLLTLG